MKKNKAERKEKKNIRKKYSEMLTISGFIVMDFFLLSYLYFFIFSVVSEMNMA